MVGTAPGRQISAPDPAWPQTVETGMTQLAVLDGGPQGVFEGLVGL